MIDYIVKQYSSNPDKFKLNDELVAKAIAGNQNKGKHAKVVNPLIGGYGKALIITSPEIMKGLAVATDPAAAEAAKQQAKAAAQQEAAKEMAKMFPEEFGFTEDDAFNILQNGITTEEVMARSGGALTEEQAAEVAQRFSDAADQFNKTIDENMASQPQIKPEDILRKALEAVADPYIKSDEVQSGIKQYGELIEMMQNSQVVGPALGKAAEAVGKQFKIDPSGIADAFTMKMDEDEITRLITAYISGGAETSYDTNLVKLGYADINKPFTMSFFLKDFESKEKFLKFIDDYNQEMTDNGDEDKVISYTDVTGVLIKSVKSITNAVSYVLIAFVAISLIVSSIMIGVITYISVLERTKEIGILRAIGASKKDIARIFNAETIIIGLCAGVIGIGLSLLLLIPINKVLISLTKISALKAILPAVGGVALVLISIFLTFIAGLIPSGMAARKDPVVALRTE